MFDLVSDWIHRHTTGHSRSPEELAADLVAFHDVVRRGLGARLGCARSGQARRKPARKARTGGRSSAAARGQ
ncbi:hypothetical protein [Amycolatopsis anabasis]|uniref:hypothetical protein n=1 Tax=Amycolatopsis anabasis TaxID=1840409 RepID=UPI00131E6D9E|nr:hypothetical protein [Amycolatopsis anabasis]